MLKSDRKSSRIVDTQAQLNRNEFRHTPAQRDGYSSPGSIYSDEDLG